MYVHEKERGTDDYEEQRYYGNIVVLAVALGCFLVAMWLMGALAPSATDGVQVRSGVMNIPDPPRP